MRITLGVTDNAWASYLRARDDIYEANFWVPSGRNFMGRAAADEPFLFKTKAPTNLIVGGGFFVKFWELRVSEAWATFGEGNGVGSEEALRTAIQKYRARNGSLPDPDPTIGCIILRNVFFAPAGEDLPPPPTWGANIVQGKTFGTDDPAYAYVDHCFRAFQGAARIDPVWDLDLRGVDVDLAGPRYGEPVLTRHRLGQGSFRLSVLDAYANRCAVSGSKMAPVLRGRTYPAVRRRRRALRVERALTAVRPPHPVRPRVPRRRCGLPSSREPPPGLGLRQRRRAVLA